MWNGTRNIGRDSLAPALDVATRDRGDRDRDGGDRKGTPLPTTRGDRKGTLPTTEAQPCITV